MVTRVHLVSPGFIPPDPQQSHFVSYAAPDGFWGGLINQGEAIGMPEQELVAFANAVNRDFEIRTMDNGRVTMFPLALVSSENSGNPLTVPLLETMLALWSARMGNQLLPTVVFVISNMWNPDITALHKRWEQGYSLRGVKDLYVWAM